jgi:hypothetical protein
MSANHPNYSRNMVRQFEPYLSKTDKAFTPFWNALHLARKAKKFMLPDGGRVYEDKTFRALDESEPLHLPFPCIALEYASDKSKTPRAGETASSKRIVFVREESDSIVLTPVFWVDAESVWYPLPEAALPLTHYLSRDTVNEGWIAINCSLSDSRFPLSDYEDEIGSLLCFLNALQCSNVHAERSPAKAAGKKIKSALPFDDYYVLSVDLPSGGSGSTAAGGHRSPREHLRRGHIRRLESGRRIWINAAVVGASKGAGKIVKDYNIKPGKS